MRLAFAATAFLVATLFAAPASAAPPSRADVEGVQRVVEGSVQLARGLAATGAQLSSYGVCMAALGREETCLTIAERAYQALSRVR